MDEATRRTLRWVSVALSLPAVVWCAAPFWRGALAGLRRRELAIDVPIALAIGTAFVSNVVGTLARTPATCSSTRPRGSCSCCCWAARSSATPARARRARWSGCASWPRARPGAERGASCSRVAVAELAPGDEIVIPPGELAPVDGVLLGPETELDESALVGRVDPGRAPARRARCGRRAQRAGRDRAARQRPREPRHARPHRARCSSARRPSARACSAWPIASRRSSHPPCSSLAGAHGAALDAARRDGARRRRPCDRRADRRLPLRVRARHAARERRGDRARRALGRAS